MLFLDKNQNVCFIALTIEKNEFCMSQSQFFFLVIYRTVVIFVRMCEKKIYVGCEQNYK